MIAVSIRANDETASIACGLAQNYMATGTRNPGYQTDLCLQGLLCLYDATGDESYLAYVIETLRLRGEQPRDSLNWRILFTDIHSELWLRTRDARWLENWLDDLHEQRAHTPLDEQGLRVFFIEPERRRLLIDQLQGYVVRMARAGLVTGDASYYHEAADQYRRHASALVNPGNGLWHHGRGWNPEAPQERAPEGWCRGQAWVVRGLVEAMACIPPGSPAFNELHHLLNPLAAALLRYQGADDMWHQNVQEPEQSFPETSGTGMIIYYLERACQEGWLEGSTVRPALQRARRALRRFIDPAFNVYQGCPHCPPQTTLADYRQMIPAVQDRHAVAGVLMALSHAITPPPAGEEVDAAAQAQNH